MFWATATAPDGTTYIGIVSDSNARQVHRWNTIDSSHPDYIELVNIAVISIPTGGHSVESLWGTGILKLSKFTIDDVMTREVSLDINSGAPFLVDSWISGYPQFIFFPGINRYPDQLRRCLPATLTQVSQLRAGSVYSNEEVNNFGGRNNNEDGDNRDGDVT